MRRLGYARPPRDVGEYGLTADQATTLRRIAAGEAVHHSRLGWPGKLNAPVLVKRGLVAKGDDYRYRLTTLGHAWLRQTELLRTAAADVREGTSRAADDVAARTRNQSVTTAAIGERAGVDRGAKSLSHEELADDALRA
ncbi:hypothetical protein J421_5571 (plasmid) [Gemmatirosa kalamazoonensis]|uniref:Uncharacterized protein n=1 Tax=Gemmatirosa kalamazoonensis TaxID=861299 RepID=W0RQW7_9BACT|nr:hypothetical protein [Gemmatirosa kalamazoonensis]AHG92153.1 hypothetical protein J421_4618 [Gemmatirosa kalamazoonensis]AHG93106.1 hypothetical protein J421_5571 [Gemmatirosa kalamazoonensis]